MKSRAVLLIENLLRIRPSPENLKRNLSTTSRDRMAKSAAQCHQQVNSSIILSDQPRGECPRRSRRSRTATCGPGPGPGRRPASPERYLQFGNRVTGLGSAKLANL